MVFLLFFGFVLASCSSVRKSDSNKRSDLDGQWKLVSTKCTDENGKDVSSPVFLRHLAQGLSGETLEVEGEQVVRHVINWSDGKTDGCILDFPEKWEVAGQTIRSMLSETKITKIGKKSCPTSFVFINTERTYRYSIDGKDLEIVSGHVENASVRGKKGSCIEQVSVYRRVR